MRSNSSRIRFLLCSGACVVLSACQHSSVDTRAEELLRTGAARDMAEARQMVADHDWPESAERREEDARRAREAKTSPKK